MWMLKYIILLRPISSIFEHTYLSTNYEIITWRNFYQWKLVILLYLNVKQEVNEWKRVHLRSIRHSCLARHIKSTIAEQKKNTKQQQKGPIWHLIPNKNHILENRTRQTFINVLCAEHGHYNKKGKRHTQTVKGCI